MEAVSSLNTECDELLVELEVTPSCSLTTHWSPFEATPVEF